MPITTVLDRETLQRGLRMPADARALLLIAHPDAASRRDPGHAFVADVLRANSFATLTFSLQGLADDGSVSATPGLVQSKLRIRAVVEWVTVQPALAGRPVVLIGIGDAVAACIGAAARHSVNALQSLVLLDGRGDLVPHHLARLTLPTLFVLGRCDARRVVRHRVATRHMSAAHRLEVMALPTQPRPAPGALEAFACTAMEWLDQTLPKGARMAWDNLGCAAA